MLPDATSDATRRIKCVPSEIYGRRDDVCATTGISLDVLNRRGFFHRHERLRVLLAEPPRDHKRDMTRRRLRDDVCATTEISLDVLNRRRFFHCQERPRVSLAEPPRGHKRDMSRRNIVYLTLRWRYLTARRHGSDVFDEIYFGDPTVSL